MNAQRATSGARRVDPRVSDSPLVSLRYHVDTWAGDLDQLGEELRARLEDVREQRSQVMHALYENEGMRRHILNSLTRYAARDVARCFHEGFSLSEQLGRLDEQAAGLRRRAEAVRSAAGVLRAVRSELRRLAATGELQVSEQSARLTQAARRILQLMEEQHEETAQAIIQGPMQRLAEASFEAEVASRVVTSDVATAAEHASRCRAVTAAAAQELDRLVERLRPIDADRPLSAALREMLRVSPARDGGRLRVMGAEHRLPALQEQTLFRIVEEAVDNAIRHGHSSHIDVILSYHDDRVVAVVKDDGDGFDVVATEARLGRTRALGLIEMHERAALVGTKLEVRSLIGAGTEVRVMLGSLR